MPERAREIVNFLVASGAGAGTVGGFWAFITRRQSSKSEIQTSEAAILSAATRLQEVMNDAAERTVNGLRNELQAVKAEAEGAKNEARQLRDRVEQLEGANRQAIQHIESLESVLRKQGIDIPTATAPGTLLIVADNTATVLRASRKPKETP